MYFLINKSTATNPVQFCYANKCLSFLIFSGLPLNAKYVSQVCLDEDLSSMYSTINSATSKQEQ